jgi:1-acyl-sn-glycerol-3-phosphate acyltransferase
MQDMNSLPQMKLGKASNYHLINRIVAKLLWLCFHRIIHVEQKENLSKAPHPLIFAYNHNNYFETLLLGSYLVNSWPQKKISFLIDWMYGKLPVIGWFLGGLQPVYVYTKRARWDFLNRRKMVPAQNIIHECLEKLRQGCSLGIFPEGTRNQNPFVLKRGRRGVGEIVLRSQTPVLPVGIDFPGRALKGRIPRFGKIIFRFGEPLHFPMEITAWQEASQGNTWAPQLREKMRIQLSSQIIYQIMAELAKLSGKRYPFRQPRQLEPYC